MKPYIYLPLLTIVCNGCFLFEQEAEEPMGTLHIEALLANDTCGPGINPGDPTMSYEVALKRSGDSLVWHGPDGPIQGALSNDEDFCIELTNQWHVRDPDPWYDDPGCDMVNIERLCGELTFSVTSSETEGETQQVTSLSARHESYVSANTGSNCSDQIGLAEGQFLALPCQISYTLTGVALDN